MNKGKTRGNTKEVVISHVFFILTSAVSTHRLPVFQVSDILASLCLRPFFQEYSLLTIFTDSSVIHSIFIIILKLSLITQ
jgi:hypothetical protein